MLKVDLQPLQKEKTVMYENWKASTIIFALQVIAGAATWYSSGSFLVTAIVVWLVPTLAFTTTSTITSHAAFVAAFASSFPIIAAIKGAPDVAGVGAATAYLAILLVPLFVYYSTLHVEEHLKNESERSKEPRGALNIAITPAGIGTFVGGLLYFFFFRNKQNKDVSA